MWYYITPFGTISAHWFHWWQSGVWRHPTTSLLGDFWINFKPPVAICLGLYCTELVGSRPLPINFFVMDVSGISSDLLDYCPCRRSLEGTRNGEHLSLSPCIHPCVHLSGFPTIFCNLIQTWYYWMSFLNGFSFGSHWPNFRSLVVQKWLKLVVSDCYLKNYSHNTIQTWCLHLLGECS